MPVFTSGVKVYSKEALDDEICRLITANTQLITDKMETEKVRINLEADKVRLFGEKNSLVVKREELRVEIAMLNVAGLPNISIYGHQNPLLRLTRDKLKAKRPPSFDNLKENL